MTTHSAGGVEGAFSRIVERLEQSITVSVDAHAQGGLRKTELYHLYEATFLQLVTAFESFLEELFYSCVVGRSGIKGVTPALHFPRRAAAAEFLLENQRSEYLTWLQLERVVFPRARLYLVGGRPFTRLERRQDEAKVLRNVVAIRNAIAHQSDYSKREFVKVAGSSSRVGVFLSRSVSTSTQFKIYCDELRRIARALSASTEFRANKHLREELFHSGAKPGAGKYLCKTCGGLTVIVGKNSLPKCATCSPACGHCGHQGKTTEFRRA